MLGGSLGFEENGCLLFLLPALLERLSSSSCTSNEVVGRLSVEAGFCRREQDKANYSLYEYSEGVE